MAGNGATSRARIALFLPTLDDGGAEHVMLQLGVSFMARGHDVDLVVGVPDGPIVSKIPSQLRLVDLGASRTTKALPALVRYLRRERPTALLSTLEHSNVLAVWAAWLARARTRIVLREASVVPRRDQLKGVRPHVLHALMRRFYRPSDAVVGVSHSVAQSLIAELGLPAHQVHTIYNPIVTADLEDRASAPLPVDDPWFAPGAPPVVLAVGRMAPAKDYPTLLRAFAKVRAQRPARLLILGEGKERPALEALTQELAIGADVRMPGFEQNPLRYMRRATVVALASVWEGLPGVLIQGMACGTRVIATDAPGGSREVLQDGALGPLVAMGDVEAFARGIVGLLADADKGPARVQYPLERFTERASVDEYLRVLGVAVA
jgi:glycosyltransferase involved in cell wall biosynthesis